MKRDGNHLHLQMMAMLYLCPELCSRENAAEEENGLS